MRSVTRLPVLLAAALLVGGSVLAGAVPAQAHDELRASTPAAGAVVDQLPAQVVLTMDEPPVAVGTQIVVTGPDGPVQDGPVQVTGVDVRQPVRSGPAGTYAVTWRVTSADGHPVSGTFEFTTSRSSVATPTTTTTSTTTTSTTSTPASPSTTTNPPLATAASAGGGAPVGPIALAVLVLLVAVALGWWWSRQRSRPAG